MTNYPIMLAGDVGGTKTALALFTRPGQLPVAEKTFFNKEYDGLIPIIAQFLADSDLRPLTACFAIAGPVMGERVRMTNLQWDIDAAQLRQEFALKSVSLINDLMATAQGALVLPGEKLFSLQSGKRREDGNVAVIAPGTGLGESFMIHTGKGFVPCATEGGHSGFSPQSELQCELLTKLRQSHDFVSVEDVCSGPAIGRLYDIFVAQEGEEIGEELIFTNDDRTPLIVKAALASLQPGVMPCQPAMKAVRMLVDILAGEAANLALKTLATGGIYIGGGIPPRILPFFDQQRFSGLFSRGVYQEMLADIPINIILEPRTALLGAAVHGFSVLEGVN